MSKHLQQMVARWLEAEAGDRPDVEARASAALQALPAPRPSRDLVAAVMAALSPASLWSRWPFRWLVAAAALVMGVGILATLGAFPALAAIAGLSLWRELGSHLLVFAVEFAVDLVRAVETMWQAVSDSAARDGWGVVALGIAAVMFLSGTAALTRLSIWRDEENWRHV